jgi:hypothetical protein
MADAQKALVEARMKFVAAHASLIEAYETAGPLPWDCDEARETNKPIAQLSVVKG